MITLREHIEQTIRDRRLLKRGQALLVAVSGGLDSMVLLDLLCSLAQRHRWRLSVGHLNHQLRGRASDADERLVREVARRLRVPVCVERADVRSLAETQKLSLEMAARKARHAFLARAAAQGRSPSIALAHHADDQVELFFLRLLRGAGGEGLSGMKWHGASPADPALQLVRPLLDLPKSALREYAVARGIRFREDASNASFDFQRNRIRHQLLPLLKENFQPALEKVILRLMEVLGAEAELGAQLADGWLERHGLGRASDARKSRPSSDSADFDELPVAVQRRCVQSQLLRLGIATDYELVEKLRLSPGKAASIGLSRKAGETPAPVVAVCEPNGIVRLREARGPEFSVGSLELSLDGQAGEVDFDGVRIEWQCDTRHPRLRPKPSPGKECFDAEAVGRSVLLRHWRPGDRFQPIGMKSALKLQDFFTNEKVPRHRRHQLLVAVSARGDIFWVEGLRIGEQYKLGARSNRRLQWAWQRF